MKKFVLLAAVALSAVLQAQGPRITPAETQAIAEEAYVFAYPMLENYQRLFRGGADPSATFNRFVHNRELAGPESRRVIRPNNDTLYSSTWLDLRAAPLVITIPPVSDGRYWSLQVIDIYTHNAAIVSPRNAASTGTQCVIAGPSWNRPSPSGMDRVVRVESQFAMALIRIEVRSADDLPNVIRLQNQIRLSPLGIPPGDRAVGLAPRLASRLTFPPFSREQAEAEGFIEYLNVLLGQLAVHPSEQALLARFSQIGIGANRPFDSSALDGPTRAAIRGGVLSALEKINGGRNSFSQPRGRWTAADNAFGNRERMQGRYLDRSVAARAGLYGLDREEAVYLNAAVDANGEALNGSRGTYAIHFSAADVPPAKAFWSLTMYGDDGFMVANPKQRYSIGDRTPGLMHDADGGFTIWLSSQSPGALREANWLPAPSGRFTLALRIYLPDQRVDRYVPPPVARAN